MVWDGELPTAYSIRHVVAVEGDGVWLDDTGSGVRGAVSDLLLISFLGTVIVVGMRRAVGALRAGAQMSDRLEPLKREDPLLTWLGAPLAVGAGCLQLGGTSWQFGLGGAAATLGAIAAWRLWWRRRFSRGQHVGEW